MLPILFMNDLLVSPAQDMLALPSTFSVMFAPVEGIPHGASAIWNLC